MKKPLTIVYGVEDAPPLGVTLVSGVQHVVLIAIRLLFPLLVAREAGLAPERILDVLGVSMLIMGLGPVLQAMTRGPVGSGYLCPTSFTSAYIAQRNVLTHHHRTHAQPRRAHHSFPVRPEQLRGPHRWTTVS